MITVEERIDAQRDAFRSTTIDNPLLSPDALRVLFRQREQALKENNVLRGLLGNSSKPCTYCGLAAEDQAKCAAGFPGCSRADDQSLSEYFAAGWHLKQAEAERDKARAMVSVAREALDNINMATFTDSGWTARQALSRLDEMEKEGEK
jgi:hypothetical protein